MSYLEIRHVAKTYESREVLSDISLAVDAGEFVTLLGPSGCGKTTLLRIIAGLERASGGRILCREQTFFDHRSGVDLPVQKRGLGFVFQDYGLWPHMSVFDNVAFALKVAHIRRPEIKQRVMQALSDVGLEEYSGKRPAQLSGGQKQRVAIARALASRNELVLFDEPLSNLDANLRESLGGEIRALSKRFGLTCINVTHDRREAQLLSDRVALMRDGRIHRYAAPDELFANPGDVWTARFLDAGNLLPANWMNADSEAHSCLIPRTALKVCACEHGVLQGQLQRCRFIEDRYELDVRVRDREVRLYSRLPLTVGVQVGLQVEPERVQWLGRQDVETTAIEV